MTEILLKIKDFFPTGRGMTLLFYYAVLSAAIMILLVLIKNTARMRLRRIPKKNRKLKAFSAIVSEMHYFFLLAVSLEAASFFSQINPALRKAVSVFTVIALVCEISSVSGKAVSYVTDKIRRNSGNRISENFISAVKIAVKFSVYSAGFILILSTLGFKVSVLVTSLGITSIAIAFAFQNILTDIFSSVTIYIDKPFVQGDFIKFDDILGTIVKIGVRSTRISGLGGEEVIISNNQLANKTVRNFSNMKRRRAVIFISVVYETPVKKLQRIPWAIKDIIESIDGVECTRSNLKELGEYSVNFEAEYYVNSPDYAYFMEINEIINISVMKYMEKNKIEFAYPTRKINLRRFN